MRDADLAETDGTLKFVLSGHGATGRSWSQREQHCTRQLCAGSEGLGVHPRRGGMKELRRIQLHTGGGGRTCSRATVDDWNVLERVTAVEKA